MTFPLARALLASAALFVAFLAFPWVREIVPGLAQSDALFWGDPSLGEIAYMGVAALVFGSLLALQARLVAEFLPEGVEVTGGPQSGFLNFVFGALKTFALPVVLTIAGAYALNKLGLATN